MLSLNRRMVFSASFVLAVFIVLTAWGLDRAFYDSARSARQERLLGQLYLVIAAAEVDSRGDLSLPSVLSESRFNLPGSGLYAYATNAQGNLVWRSASAIGEDAPYQKISTPGERRLEQRKDAQGEIFYVQSLGVNWATGATRHAFTFSVTENLNDFNAQLHRYRRSLWTWLAATAALLLLAQAAVLRWGLKPLRRITKELNAIEAGRQTQVQGRYPKEIQRLTDNLNSLIQHEHAQQQRYRNALGDLAHSLKTPLAVIRGSLQGPAEHMAAIVDEQVARMDNIVAYQLQRAATAGATAMTASAVPILPIAEKIGAALAKVHAEKKVNLTIAVEPKLLFMGDTGDLTEMLGNLLDNAYKWSLSKVQLSAALNAGELIIRVEDDGPGIAAAQGEQLGQRGVRMDENVPGHGIGLAVVRDIVEAYRGRLEIGTSAFGGAAISLYFSQIGDAGRGQALR